MANMFAIALANSTLQQESVSLPLLEPCAEFATTSACRVPGALDAATALRRLDAKREAFWVEDEVFHVVARRGGSKAVLCCAIQSLMERVGDEPDLWAISIRVPRIAEAVLDVVILSDDNAPLPAGETPHWRGPDAPVPAEIGEIPQGALFTQEIRSAALAETRVIEIYRPAGRSPMPVIYLADGESVGMFAKTLSPLIERGDLSPVMIVGLHSGASKRVDGESASLMRHQEYLPNWFGVTQPRFAAHSRFFTEEVVPLAESYGASPRPEDRAVAGFSNGAAWALAMATDHQGMFDKVLLMSFGWTEAAFMSQMQAAAYGDVWMGAGTLEPPFHGMTHQAADVLRGRARRLRVDTRVAGHSPLMWRDQFPAAVRWLFGQD